MKIFIHSLGCIYYYCYCIEMFARCWSVAALVVFGSFAFFIGYKMQFFTRNFNYLLVWMQYVSSYHPHVLSRVFYHATHADKAWPCACVCALFQTILLTLHWLDSVAISRLCNCFSLPLSAIAHDLKRKHMCAVSQLVPCRVCDFSYVSYYCYYYH